MELTNKILDTALLSELAYLKLENEYFKDKNYSLDNINKFFNSKDDEGKPLDYGIDDSRKQAIIDLLANYTIVDFKNIPTSFAGLNDLQAMLLRDKEGNTTIAFRGTDGISDIAIDALMLQGGYTNQMYSALQWVRDLKSSGMLTGNVTITGHSLGGSLAQLVGYDTGYETYTYNAFALQRNEAIEVLGEKTTDNIINLQLGEDIVSGLGSQIGGAGEGIIHDIIDNIGTVVPSAYTKYLDVGNILLQGSINYIKDTINKSHLGQLVTLFDIDDVSISDLITDHFMSGFSSAFELYRSNNIDLSDIFMTEDIQEINTQLGYILANANMNIDVEGMPKAVENRGQVMNFHF